VMGFWCKLLKNRRLKRILDEVRQRE
jgi:hypothetical protein